MVAETERLPLADAVGMPDPRDRLAIAGIRLPVWRRIWLLLGLTAALVLPFVLENFTIFQMTLALVYAMPSWA